MHATCSRGRTSILIAVSRTVTASLVAGALAATPTGAAARYTCKVLDVPGSAWTQLWQLNDAGAVAAGSSLGGYVYSGGAWIPLPPAPGYAAENVGVLGINNSGVLAGVARPPDGSSAQGFILSGGTYTFFSYPGYVTTEARAISNSGIVTGTASLAVGSGTGVGFVYNPTGAPGYPAGFSEIIPTRSGSQAWQTIPGMMNDAGQLVGSANFTPGGRFAFIYDPNQVGSPDGSLTVFQIEGRYTAARGINDSGYVAGFTRDATGKTVGYVLMTQGYQVIDCSADIAGAVDTMAESINDSGVVSGIWSDSSGNADNLHGFVAYPDVVLPVASSGGAFVFDVAVSPGTPVFLDPAVAVGYRYAVGAGDPLFSSVTLPIGIGDDVYTVLAGGRAFTLAAGQRLGFVENGFAGGVAAFEVLGIETSAALDPADATAFVTEVSFAGAGRFTGTMTPMTAADELADLRAAASAAGAGQGIAEKVRRAAAFHAAGDLSHACKALSDFVFDVSGKSGQQLPAQLAGALLAEAHAVEAAVGCP